MDATTPVTKQDLAIAQRVVDEGRAIVIALNKMDAVDKPKLIIDAVKDRIEQAVWQAGGVECVPISATLGKNTRHIMPAVYGLCRYMWNVARLLSVTVVFILAQSDCV
jgi:GTPase